MKFTVFIDYYEDEGQRSEYYTIFSNEDEFLTLRDRFKKMEGVAKYHVFPPNPSQAVVGRKYRIDVVTSDDNGRIYGQIMKELYQISFPGQNKYVPMFVKEDTP